MSGRFTGKNVLVTGANSGIGLAAAERFVEEGARVFIVGRDRERLDASVARLGPEAVGIQADITRQAELDHVFETIRTRADRLDVVVANAGGGSHAPMGAFTEQQFDDRLDGERQRGGVHRPGSAAPDTRWRRGGPGRLDQCQYGAGRPRLLRRLEGGAAVLRPDLDH